VSFRLPNFTTLVKSNVEVGPNARKELDVILQLTLSASVVVTGKATFTNLADVEDPSASLLGVADSATQGAITAKQLDTRPLMRVGEVLETVPGLVISQHSGEGKANQYYLRGFNLDHGTDFATTVAGMPVNMPTHAHGQGYSDLSFLIPELVSGVQFRKGPYFAEDGDFSSAGSATINYVNVLDRPVARLSGGQEGWARVVAAASPAVSDGRMLTAIEIAHDDGPWTQPDEFRKVNGVMRYSRGDGVNGIALTGMAYQGRWHSTDQVPDRAIRERLISRFGNIDSTDGGTASRYSGSVDWQRARGNEGVSATAYGIRRSSPCFRISRSSSMIRCTVISSSKRTGGSSPEGGSPTGALVSGRDAPSRPSAECSCGTTISGWWASITPRVDRASGQSVRTTCSKRAPGSTPRMPCSGRSGSVLRQLGPATGCELERADFIDI
jgi:hypothetical protein